VTAPSPRGDFLVRVSLCTATGLSRRKQQIRSRQPLSTGVIIVRCTWPRLGQPRPWGLLGAHAERKPL